MEYSEEDVFTRRPSVELILFRLRVGRLVSLLPPRILEPKNHHILPLPPSTILVSFFPRLRLWGWLLFCCKAVRDQLPVSPHLGLKRGACDVLHLLPDIARR